MIIPDINLLLYAHVNTFNEHKRARAWWNDTMNGDIEVGLPEAVVFGFIRVSTNARVFRLPLKVEDARACVEGWLEHPGARLLPHSSESVELALKLLTKLGTAGNLTTDVQIAALALHHQATVHSRDTDFARFPGLSWKNPFHA